MWAVIVGNLEEILIHLLVLPMRGQFRGGFGTGQALNLAVMAEALTQRHLHDRGRRSSVWVSWDISWTLSAAIRYSLAIVGSSPRWAMVTHTKLAYITWCRGVQQFTGVWGLQEDLKLGGTCSAQSFQYAPFLAKEATQEEDVSLWVVFFFLNAKQEQSLNMFLSFLDLVNLALLFRGRHITMLEWKMPWGRRKIYLGSKTQIKGKGLGLIHEFNSWQGDSGSEISIIFMRTELWSSVQGAHFCRDPAHTPLCSHLSAFSLGKEIIYLKPGNFKYPFCLFFFLLHFHLCTSMTNKIMQRSFIYVWLGADQMPQPVK